MPTCFPTGHISVLWTSHSKPFGVVTSISVVNALEDQMSAGAHQGALGRVNQINILWADHYVNRLIVAKALVHAGESGTEDFNQLIAEHDAGNDVALADEVCHEGIFRLVVNLLRGYPSAGCSPDS